LLVIPFPLSVLTDSGTGFRSPLSRFDPWQRDSIRAARLPLKVRRTARDGCSHALPRPPSR
jgi:hypothetical protein